MANIKQQKKRIVTDEKRRQHNVGIKSRMRTYIKKVDEAMAAGDADAIKAAATKAISEIDRACSSGVIHANSAARKKSSIVRRTTAKVS